MRSNKLKKSAFNRFILPVVGLAFASSIVACDSPDSQWVKYWGHTRSKGRISSHFDFIIKHLLISETLTAWSDILCRSDNIENVRNIETLETYQECNNQIRTYKKQWERTLLKWGWRTWRMLVICICKNLFGHY